ncbi:MAG TPA: hypothetical protein VM243_16730 [Phycisphaerae bacterium]|nr:hypothetical protein [Phycisphaerae bacterium]
MNALIAVLLLAAGTGPPDAGPADAAGDQVTPLSSGQAGARADQIPPPTDDDVRQAIRRGIDFLLKAQNDDGSWGGQGDSLTTWSGGIWSNPETHRAWKVAVTGLCCAALLEVGTSDDAVAATDRAIRYLIDNADVKRPNEWDTMNNWAYIYGLQGLAAAYGHPRYADSPLRAEIAASVAKHVHNLARFQSVSGGWGYLELNAPRTRRPQWATSFMTAAAVVAMQEARRNGLEVDQGVIDRAIRIIKHCRLPNGGYTYHVRAIPNLHSEYIDQVKGSLSRIQVCHAALILSGEPVPPEDLLTGMGHFFREHKFLDLAMHKPVPHEAYYYNSGYFYMFGHYYAALVIERLGPEAQAKYWPKLRHEIIKIQQKDGSIWDYDMHRYDRPYGVAYGLMALGRSLR